VFSTFPYGFVIWVDKIKMSRSKSPKMKTLTLRLGCRSGCTRRRNRIHHCTSSTAGFSRIQCLLLRLFAIKEPAFRGGCNWNGSRWIVITTRGRLLFKKNRCRSLCQDMS